jgi:hypothetical protein
MQAEHSQAIIRWIAENSDVALFACYEQIKPNDQFGKMMIENLDVSLICIRKRIIYQSSHLLLPGTRGAVAVCKGYEHFLTRNLKLIDF